VILVACGNKSPAQLDAAARDAAVEVDTVMPDAAPDCKRLLDNLRNAVDAAWMGMRPEAAPKLWTEMPEVCRDGRWYLDAALLLDLGIGKLTAGSIELSRARDALSAALAQHDDLDVLARVAFVSAIRRGPKLPADACERARRTITDPHDRLRMESVVYVCTRAALEAHDARKAQRELAGFDGTFLDSALLRAQVAKLAGERPVKQDLKDALGIDVQGARNREVNAKDRAAMIELAKSIAH